MLTTMWTGLALTGLHPHLFPAAASEPRPTDGAGARLATAALGLAGLGAWAACMVVLKKRGKLGGAPLKVTDPGACTATYRRALAVSPPEPRLNRVTRAVTALPD